MITIKGNGGIYEGDSTDTKPSDVAVNTIFHELDTNCKYYFTGEDWAEIPSSGGGGGGGTDNYNELSNKPSINSVTLSGNKTAANLGLQAEITGDVTISSDNVDDTGATNLFVTSAEKSTWNGKQDALTIDSAPTENSTNPVQSGGVYTALSGKQAALAFDGTYSATTNKVATESTVSGAISALDKSSVGLGNVTNNAQVKAVSGSVTSGDIVTFGADGATVQDSGKAIETSLSDSNNKVPTSKAVRDNVAANATMSSGYAADSSEASITSSTSINDAIEQLDYRTTSNKTNILLVADQSTQYNLSSVSDMSGTSGFSPTYFLDTPIPAGTYRIICDNVRTDTTKQDQFQIVGIDGGASQYVNVAPTITTASYKSNEFTTTFDIYGIKIYCNTPTTVSNIAIISKSLWDKGFTDFQPYALPNTTLTPALVECVDKGQKNLAPLNSASATSTGYFGDTTINLPAGEYKVSFKLTTSSTLAFLITVDGSEQNKQLLNPPYNASTMEYDITANTGITRYRFYANGSATVTDFMICPKSLYDASRTYQPYAMSNVELTAILGYDQITNNTDLNTLITLGKRYQCGSSSIAATLTNCPTTDGFMLEVKETVSIARFMQEIIPNKANEIYRRWYTTTGFSSWYKFVGTAVT